MTEARVEVIRRLVRRGATASLRRALDKVRPEDIAIALRHLAPAEARRVVSIIEDDEVVAEVLPHLDEGTLRAVAEGAKPERLVRWLEMIEVDDEADIIDRLPEPLRQRVLDALEAHEKSMVEDILSWPEDSAGGIMQPLAFRLHEETTCREAIAALHEQQEGLEMVFYLYVENDAGQLVGVTSLRALLIHPPSTPLREFMTTDVIAVSPDTDQEEVARLASRYDLLAIPVVDEGRRLLGIVTIDDVVDVIREEAIEDMMRMVGVQEEGAADGVPALAAAGRRASWMAVTAVAGLLMAAAMRAWGSPLAERAALLAFLPAVLGVSGHVGGQAAAVAVRDLALGRASGRALCELLLRELRVGLLLGGAVGLVLGAGSLALWGLDPARAAAVAGAAAASALLAAAAGALLPPTLSRLGVDPANVAGPVVAAVTDVLALLATLGAAALALRGGG